MYPKWPTCLQAKNCEYTNVMKESTNYHTKTVNKINYENTWKVTRHNNTF